MRDMIKGKIDSMVEYYGILKSEFKWTANDYSVRFAAFTYAISEKEFDLERLKSLIRYIKSKTSIFSYHRATQLLSEAALLITHFDDEKSAFDKLIDYEEKMKQKGFKSSQYLSIAAYSLMFSSSEEFVLSRINKAIDIYKKMKNQHFWLTSHDDYPVAVLLSGEEGTVEELNRKIEILYEELRNEGFHRGNGLQYLAHLLTFSAEDKEIKVKRCRKIYDRLKQHKLKVSSMHYGILGFLGMLGEDAEEALNEVVEAVDYLNNIKGFKMFYKDLNLTFISAIINNEHLEARKRNLLNTGVHISIQMMIAAQQAAAIAAASAAASAAAASASASS